jgi:hypothetical protein
MRIEKGIVKPVVEVNAAMILRFQGIELSIAQNPGHVGYAGIAVDNGIAMWCHVGRTQVRLKSAKNDYLASFFESRGNLKAAEDLITHGGYADNRGIGIKVYVVEVLEAELLFPIRRYDRA